MNKINIKSERFNQRLLTIHDATYKYLNWFEIDNVQNYIEYANQNRSLEELRHYIQEKSDKKDTLFLGIFLKDGGEHIGNVKYEPIDSVKQYAVMGILIGEKDWYGKGVACEVIQAGGMWLHEHMNINQIALGVALSNVSAIKAYKKIGFIESDSEYLSVDNEHHQTMVWNISE